MLFTKTTPHFFSRFSRWRTRTKREQKPEAKWWELSDMPRSDWSTSDGPIRRETGVLSLRRDERRRDEARGPSLSVCLCSPASLVSGQRVMWHGHDRRRRTLRPSETDQSETACSWIWIRSVFCQIFIILNVFYHFYLKLDFVYRRELWERPHEDLGLSRCRTRLYR